MVDQRTLVVKLQTPFHEYLGNDVREIILAGLRWPTDTSSGYWQSLAVKWIKQGASLDTEMIVLLDVIAKTGHLPQKLRHDAQGIIQSWAVRL